MRALSPIFALLIALLAVSPRAYAEDATDAEGAKKKVEIKIPSFSIEILVPAKEGLLEGWTVLEDDPAAGQPSDKSLMALAEANGLNEDTAYVEQRVVKTPGGAKAGIAMMDIDADPAKFLTALKAKATEAGWTVRELAVPNRLLIVGGEPAIRDEVTNEVIAHIVYEFTALARKRFNTHSTWDKETNETAKAAAKGFIMAGRALVPEAGTMYAVESFFDLRTHLQKKGEAAANKKRQKAEKDEKKEEEFRKKHLDAKKASKEALAAFLVLARKAVDPKAPLPPRGTLRASLSGRAGGLLLEQKKDDMVAESVRFLKIAVESAPDRGEEMDLGRYSGYRYNLACAYARQGNKDLAFDMLRKSLEMGKLLTYQAYGQSFVHMEEKDDDMKPLRSDERWGPMIKEFRTDKVTKFVEMKKKQEERKKKEAERRKKNNPHNPHNPHGG